MSIVLNGTTGITTPDIETVDATFSGGVYLGGTGAANYLDDYEEGTWTPAWNFSTSGSVTVSAGGRYTKIGNKVFVEIVIYTTAISSPSGNASITGLPFTPTNPQGTMSIGYKRRWATDMPNLIFLIQTTGIYGFVNATNAAGATNLSGSDFDSGGAHNSLYLSGFYTV